MIRSLSLALLLTVCALSASAGERIITLGSAATETAFALAAGERVVAVDSSSLWPPAARQRPVVGYYRSLNAEGLLSLRPDHVIGSDQLGPPIVPQQLRAAGVRVDLLPTPDSRQSLLAYFPAFAARLGLPLENAVALQQKIARQLDQAAAMNNGAQPKVLILMSAGHGLMAAGRQTAAALMLELVGASNAVDFSHYKPSSAEALLGASPDAIVLAGRGPTDEQEWQRLRQHPALAHTPALKNGRLITMDAGLLLGLGPRTGEAAIQLAQALLSR